MALCLVIDRDTGTWNLDNVMTNYCNQDFDLEQDTGIWPVIVTQDRLQEPESRPPTGTRPIVVAQDRLQEPES